MPEENNGGAADQDGVKSSPDGGATDNGAAGSDQDGFDSSLLDALLDDDSSEDDEKEDDDSKKDDGGDKADGAKADAADEKKQDMPDLKIGDRVFNSVEELKTWAAKQNGKVQDLIGQLKAAKELTPADRDALKKELKDEILRETKVEEWRGQVEKFWETNPDAKDYREEMAVFLRKGKANDASGKPSLSIAYAKALQADGKEVPEGLLEGVKKETDTNNQKAIMSSGNGRGSLSSAGYTNSNDVKRVSDEGDAMIFGRR